MRTFSGKPLHLIGACYARKSLCRSGGGRAPPFGRRLRRKFLAFALMSVAVILLWLRSYWAGDCARWMSERGTLYVADAPRGAIVLCRITGGHRALPNPFPGLRYLDPPPRDLDRHPAYDLEQWATPDIVTGHEEELSFVRNRATFAGFGWQTMGMAKIRAHTTPQKDTNAWFILVPYWFLALATLVPTMLYARRLAIHIHRSACERCLECGYDLRASPRRCPECGATRPTDPLNSGAAQRCLT